jgi:uncharacterized membrane protein YgdD (TMEM256/DUF423 family)
MIAVLAALSAALAIGAGAFGAHGASSPQAAEWLRTGGLYQMVHAVAVLALLRTPGMHGIGAAMLAGAAIFAFTLYAMAFGGPRWLGAVTPIGGTVMILAWLAVAWRMARV